MQPQKSPRLKMNFELWENYVTKATLRMDYIVELRYAHKVISVPAISNTPNNDTICQLFKLKMNFKLVLHCYTRGCL